jgi:anti-sigma factor RsiW
MAHCEAESLTLRFLAGELEQPDQERYLAHLKQCEPCQELTRAGVLWADELIFRISNSPPPPAVLRRLEKRVASARQRRWSSSWAGLAVAAALLFGVGIGHAMHAGRPPAVAATKDLVALTGSYGHRYGHMVVWQPSGRAAMTISSLAAPPKNQVYEVWRIDGVGPKALGTLHYKGGRGWFVVKGGLKPGDQIVVCTEQASWGGEWMGSVVLSATVPVS